MANIKTTALQCWRWTNVQTNTAHVDNQYTWSGIKIPIGDKALIIHYGEFHIGQNGNITLSYFYPYSDVTYGIGTCGMTNDGAYTNGLYYDTQDASSIRFASNSADQIWNAVVIGFGAL